MHVLTVRNVHSALPAALNLLKSNHIRRGSRNGPVLEGPPVTTVYTNPQERVMFWEERDANPFFHLYEMLWMVAGRNDVAGPARYAKNMTNYSDDGKTFHGAYGRRWRSHFFPKDQISVIIRRLIENREDRRCVLQMWDPEVDLDHNGKDVPCNLTATVQCNAAGRLDLTVFCRSNDIIWGAYGANAVHFSFLQEYIARSIGAEIGTYRQVSVNWHAYDNELLERVWPIAEQGRTFDRYRARDVVPTVLPLATENWYVQMVQALLAEADLGFEFSAPFKTTASFYHVARTVLMVHHLHKTLPRDYANRWREMAHVLSHSPIEEISNATFRSFDWIVAAKEWLERRQKAKVQS